MSIYNLIFSSHIFEPKKFCWFFLMWDLIHILAYKNTLIFDLKSKYMSYHLGDMRPNPNLFQWWIFISFFPFILKKKLFHTYLFLESDIFSDNQKNIWEASMETTTLQEIKNLLLNIRARRGRTCPHSTIICDKQLSSQNCGALHN